MSNELKEKLAEKTVCIWDLYSFLEELTLAYRSGRPKDDEVRLEIYKLMEALRPAIITE